MPWAKLFSGRFVLTVVCGIVFLFCALKQIKLDEAQATILTAVFISYFQMKRDNPTTITK